MDKLYVKLKESYDKIEPGWKKKLVMGETFDIFLSKHGKSIFSYLLTAVEYPLFIKKLSEDITISNKSVERVIEFFQIYLGKENVSKLIKSYEDYGSHTLTGLFTGLFNHNTLPNTINLPDEIKEKITRLMEVINSYSELLIKNINCNNEKIVVSVENTKVECSGTLLYNFYDIVRSFTKDFVSNKSDKKFYIFSAIFYILKLKFNLNNNLDPHSTYNNVGGRRTVKKSRKPNYKKNKRNGKTLRLK
jgi:hypothetical protein